MATRALEDYTESIQAIAFVASATSAVVARVALISLPIVFPLH